METRFRWIKRSWTFAISSAALIRGRLLPIFGVVLLTRAFLENSALFLQFEILKLQTRDIWLRLGLAFYTLCPFSFNRHDFTFDNYLSGKIFFKKSFLIISKGNTYFLIQNRGKTSRVSILRKVRYSNFAELEKEKSPFDSFL